MSDLHYGETCTELYQFISAGNAHTFKFKFQPDKVVFNNTTQFAGVAGNKPISIWWRNQTVAAHASQQVVLADNGTTGNFNFINQATNGFTVADTPGGVSTSHSAISAITQANPCVITHDTAVPFETNQIVRLTNLGAIGPGITTHGMDNLNNNRYKIVVLSSTTFSLKDVITGEPIDSTLFPVYVSGGIITLETHVISLNNPQVFPYSNLTPYLPNPYTYDPITYQLLVGTAVMGNNGDIFNIEVYKFGQVTNLGQLT